ncbi:RES family NAD+ phosphorylase [Salinicola sp. V024]|uniref:RES family NAD+ phosphorylase n=1 Tax=Salinicola sp. V024 TaxID=3459609 RepID=UPI0040439A66
MIELLHFVSAAYRVHDPKWAFMPTSGAGAGEHGGRLNRVGLPALYLALDEATAIAEYKQLSALMPPGLIVSYEVEVFTGLVDFREGYSGSWDPLWQELYCDWRQIWFNQRVEPPSWLIADMVLEIGAKGILFPSLARPEGTNLVLFTEALNDQDNLAAYDPHGQLPRDLSSWE